MKGAPAFAELIAATNYSFLRGASHPEEMVAAADALGLSAIGIADRNSLAGVVRAHMAAREHQARLIVGARLCFSDDTPEIAAWPRNRTGYGALSKLLTTGNRRTVKGQCMLTLADLLEHAQHWCMAIVPESEAGLSGLEKTIETINPAWPRALWIAARMAYDGKDRRRLAGLNDLATRTGIPLLASNDALYHHPDRRLLQDVVTCIREHETLKSAGGLLQRNAERHLKPAQEMARLFHDYPHAVTASLALQDQLTFSLDELAYEYPDEVVSSGLSPQDELTRLTWAGAKQRYPEGIPANVEQVLHHELALVRELNYAPYFLTVHDIVRFARERNILCQGRGSAANSAVCYCIGITEVDPKRGDLLFERFISPERREPPDIDVDFEHERREEVIQYIYEKYGRERAGLAATVITYRTRSAIRETGKVFGLSRDVVGAIAGGVWGWSDRKVSDEDLRRRGLDPADQTLHLAMEMAGQLAGFPRHLSQHVGGFVITRGRLDESVPILNAAMPDRTNIEWDKDDLDALAMLKIDVLGLGMLTCIRKAFDLLDTHYDQRLTLATVPAEDSAVYDMLCRADSLGVFQVESRAQMTMLPRLRPRNFYDLVIEVAIVRPGPIQGDMVHPYLRRRQGLEPVSYPSKDLEEVLGKTLGVPLFQEQAMRIAIVAAGFTPAEADRLRRAMATFRRVGTIGSFQDKLIEGMVERGYERDFAERCFKQIEGFGEYGFPESHAASFALLVYASSWLKCHYPDVFAAALLNAQPMGFYAPAQIIRDAREHGVEARAVDINHSHHDNTLEPGREAATRLHARHASMRKDIRSTHAIRLGFRQIKGIGETEGTLITQQRGAGYDSVRDLWLRTGLPRATIERLAEADAFRSLGLDRRDALWAARGLPQIQGGLPLFDQAGALAFKEEADADLPPMPPGEHIVNDYRFLRLSLKGHPCGFLRNELSARRILRNEQLEQIRSGRFVRVSGLVLVRQRPGSAKGVVFMTLEDETGVANVIVWPKVLERFRPVVLGARLVTVAGVVQNESGVIHVVAKELQDATHLLSHLSDDSADLEALAHADEVRRPIDDMATKLSRHGRMGRVIAEVPELAHDLKDAARQQQKTADAAMPKGRNFH